jgi:hypothetical protein
MPFKNRHQTEKVSNPKLLMCLKAVRHNYKPNKNNSLSGDPRDAWSCKTMKSAILFPYEALYARGCCRLHARHAAITSAIYTLVSTLYTQLKLYPLKIL